MLKLWWRAIRGRYLTLTCLAVLLGAAIARRQWGVSLWPAILPVLAGGLLLHAGSNLWNDYADAINGADAAVADPGPFHGGSRVIQRGELSPREVRGGACFCYGSALVLSLALVPRAGWLLPVLALLGISLGIVYSSPPFWLNGRGLGEIVVAAGFGPLMTEGAVFALAGRFSAPAFWVALPLGLLVAAILLYNSMPDRESDAAVAKQTLTVHLGIRRTVIVFCALILAALTLLAAAGAAGILPPGAWASFLAVPFAIWLCRAAWRFGKSQKRHELAASFTILLHFSLSLLLALSFLWRTP